MVDNNHLKQVENKQELLIDSVRMSDAGLYTCIAGDGNGLFETYFDLEVQGL